MKSLNDIFDFYASDKGTLNHGLWAHPHGYGSIYEPWFEPLRDKPIRLLEIGIASGSSLRSWCEYFPNAKIFAVDINDCSRFNNDRVTVARCDQGHAQELADAALRLGGSFDIIIDDGSHVAADQDVSLSTLFRHVVLGGLYIIEDLSIPGKPNGYEIDNHQMTELLQSKLVPIIGTAQFFPDQTGAFNVAIIRKSA